MHAGRIACITSLAHRILPDYTIIRRPDCLSLPIEQAHLRRTMSDHLKSEDRLSILRAEDQFTRWNSLDDERFCIVCGKKLNGRQIEIRRFANGSYELRCPTEGCNSGQHQWIYPGTLLVSDIVDSDWWRAVGRGLQKLSGPSGQTQFQRRK
jgi:hypothetical protein